MAYPPRRTRLLGWRALLLVVAYLALTVLACGRAALEGYDFDGGLDGSVDGSKDARADSDARADADAGDSGRDGDARDGDSGGGCGPANCPTGCCNNTGVCVTGNTLTACGIGGARCEDCLSEGFDFCDAQRKTCARDVNACNASTCADGCCRATAPRCLSGESPQACGDNGSGCVICQPGEICDPSTHTCTRPTTCGPGTCDGCCDAFGICQIGQSDAQCGVKGLACEVCTSGTSCVPIGPLGGFCEGPPSCAQTCAFGCCIGDICQLGTQNTACGFGGKTCQNCTGMGQVCNSNTCVTPPPQCNAFNCPNGCCNGTQCIAGTANGNCGTGGQQCQNCAALGESCQNHVCIPTCNAITCPNGCCNGNQCLGGTANGACGKGGQQCQNCTAFGETCQNKVCTAPACNGTTCPNGCCNGNQCVTGNTDTLCGTGGVACTNCQSQGNVCSAQKTCIPPCNSGTCPGCCDTTGVCNAGFVGNKCGSGGAACANCTVQNATCNITATPRVCSNQTSNCPAPYGACAAGVTTPKLSPQNACTSQLLADARAACSPGQGTASCDSYFQFLEVTNPACSACLTPFRHPFAEGIGLFNCVAPFVSSTCNHSTGCATDCLTKSCEQCPAATENQCQNTVRSNNGQCSDEYAAAACFTAGFSGAGSFCSPIQYQGNFGRWLEGVGLFYCAP